MASPQIAGFFNITVTTNISFTALPAFTPTAQSSTADYHLY
jgi:hypothetical protein